MKWIIKASIQKGISTFPAREQLNYFFQKKIARNLPINDNEFFNKIHSAIKNFNAYKKHDLDKRQDQDTFFEFGAGWDMVIPLTYFALGINNQILIDIKPHVKFDLINNALTRFTMYKDEIENRFKREFRIKASSPVITSLGDLNQIFGISYFAPLDASNTKLPGCSVSFISNTATFEHIPDMAILPILNESHRILKIHGIMSCLIDMQDHYSYVDKSISCYNFLKYNDHTFKKYNSDIHYQNRLRYSDYVNKIKEAGFSIVEENIQHPTKVDLDLLKELPIAGQFQSYNLNDLGIRTTQEILRK